MAPRLTPRQILEKLVSFPTVSRDSNLGLILWVEDYLTEHGISCTQVPAPGQPDKAGLYAMAGQPGPGGVVLSGHSDVVPVDGQDWSSDPFTVTERDGKLYGRGACDMKTFDALAIWALVEAQAADTATPLFLALSYDEEVGCTGATPIVDALLADPAMPRPETVIVGEPTRMKVVTGHKGGLGYRTHVHGFEVHSSLMHTGVNAIMEGAKLIVWANRMNDENRARTPGPLAADFVPPWTTVHVGEIEGGTAHNITAADCIFGVDFRVVPGENVDDWRAAFLEEVRKLEAEMQAIRPEAHVELTEMFTLPALKPEEAGAAEALGRRLTGDNGVNVVSYGTEAGHFQSRGLSTIVCGPGDIAQAHQPDEYIEVSQFEAGEAFMARLLDHLKE